MLELYPIFGGKYSPFKLRGTLNEWLTYIICLIHIGSALQQGFDFINVTSKASSEQWSGASLCGGRGRVV